MRREGLLRNIIEGTLERNRSRGRIGRKRIITLDEFTEKKSSRNRCLQKFVAMDLSVDRILKKKKKFVM